jgi:hypothetical protein
MIDPEVQWTTAAPFWDSVIDLDATTRRSFRQPAILRFASDDFMNEFAAVLNNNPPQLKDFRAQPETWRGPVTTPQIETRTLPRFAQKLQRSRLAIEQKAVAKALAVPDQSLTLTTSAAPQSILKLYQPAHQRYYLITAALVCRVPGQPDRHIEPNNQERVTYVVRKVVPAAGQSIFDSSAAPWSEYAFISGSWQRVTNAAALQTNEEQQPLFAVNYAQDDGKRRRVLAGLIPVGKREAYVGAPERSSNNQLVLDPDLPPPPDKRTLLFMAQVTEPWKRLIERAFAVDKMQHPPDSPLNDDDPLTGEALAASIKTNREQIQTTAWYVLLDLAKLLKQYLPNAWNSIMGEPLSSPLTNAESTLVNALTSTTISSAYASDLVQNSVYSTSEVIRNLRDALREIQGGVPFAAEDAQAIEDDLEAIVTPYDRNDGASKLEWPRFLFPLADPVQIAAGPLPPAQVGVAESTDPLTTALDRIDNFVALIAAALPAQTTEPTPPPLLASQPVMNIGVPTYFVIRCVFERPNCGPLQPVVVSDPTEPFLMAGFFDPDAPARPIRIALPVDTTPAGLRKFDKNTAFMISDVLCGQITRAQGLGLGDLIRTVLPWPLHKDLDVPDGGPCVDDAGLSLGMICSLSIPIITICALILLMIMVNLLDIIFRWVPFFIMCLPFPKFKGKSS